VQSAVFKHLRKTVKQTDHLDNEEDNTDMVSDHDVLCNDMAEQSNELNCFEGIPSPEEVVEPEDDSNSGPDNTEQNEKKNNKKKTMETNNTSC